MMFAAAAAAALVSCNKEIEKPEVPQESEGIKVTIVTGEPETKTTLGDNGKTVSWNSTDKFGFVNVAVPEDNEATIASIDGSGAATITGTVSTAGTFFAYYPKSTYAATADGGVLRIKTAQSPASGTSFDPAADVLVSETFDVAATGATTAPATVRFKRLGAFLKVYFIDNTTGSRLSGEYATTVSVQSSVKSLAAKLTINSTGIVDAANAEKTITATYATDVFELTNASQAAYLGIQPLTLPKDSQLIINVETAKYTISKTVTLPSDVTIGSGEVKPVRITLTDENVTSKTLTLKTVFAKNSTDSESWMSYFGGNAGTDRNISMDDEYIYIAESAATAKLWAISVADPNEVKSVNVEGVSGGAHALTCPRVVKNTDASVNGGKDVLICSNLTRGGEDPKLYMWVNGIDNAPKAITLTTWATSNWYGDTFTVWGTLQNGVLLFDKTDSSGNGVVTFLLNGVPGDKMYLVGRIKTVEAFGSHTGVCAFYPFPDGTAGVYSPGRGTEARGQFATLGSSLKSEGGISVTLSPLDYDEGTNGFVLGYNFVEWEGFRYVIYGNYVNNKTGYVRVRQGAITDAWNTIASTGTRLYRRDLVSGGLTADNSGMDITARVINGELYIAAQMQNVGFGLYKLCYE